MCGGEVWVKVGVCLGRGDGEVWHVYYNLLLVFLVLGFPNSCSKLGLKKTFPQ